jgi:O-antigen ligase
MKTKSISFLGIVMSTVFLASIYQAKSFTDPFMVPKHYAFMFLGITSVLGIIFFYFTKKYKLRYRITTIDFMLILFSIYLIFNQMLIGVAPLFHDIRYLNLSMAILLYFLFKPFFSSGNKEIESYKFTLTLFTFLVVLAIVQVVFAFLQLSDIIPNLQREFEIGGAYGNPGPYANFLTPLLAFSFVVAVYHKKSFLRKLAVVAVVLILVILPVTKARTSWIASIVVIGYTLLHHKVFQEMWKKYFSKIWAKVTLFIVVLGVFIGGIFILTSFKQDSASGRMFIWKVTMEMVKDKPVFGHGFSSFAPVHNDYQAKYFEGNPDDYKNAFIADGVNYAFNDFLQIASETGIFGLLLFLSVFYLVFRKKRLKHISNFEDIKILSAETAILAILVSGLFSYPLQDPATLFLLFISVAIISTNQDGQLAVFNNNKLFRQLAGGIGLIFIVLLFKLFIPRYKCEKEWIHAYQYMRQNNYKAADNIYKEIYPVMKYNQFFLFNYGAELTLMGDFEKSIKILKEVEHRMNDADFYIYLGNSFESKGSYLEAEECWIKATNIMPVKFYPNYRLAVLYQKQGNTDMAKRYAQKIIDMPVKVESELICNVKREMQDYLKTTVE